jgi:hypothetical protein
VDARAAYVTALRALGETVPRIPELRLRDTLRASEPVARLREEAAALGASA